MGKLQRNAIGGTLALVGALVISKVLLGGDQALLGWFVYCAAVGYGANRAHGDADSASITQGLQGKK